MKTFLLALPGLVLSLTLLASPLEAQRLRPWTGELGETPACHCEADGAECLFGTAGGCTARCSTPACTCEGGSCVLGFPTAAKCRCQ